MKNKENNPLKKIASPHYLKEIKGLTFYLNLLRKLQIFKEDKIDKCENKLLNKGLSQYQTIDISMELLTKEELIGACKFNIIKYLNRSKHNPAEDVKKADNYIEFLEWLER